MTPEHAHPHAPPQPSGWIQAVGWMGLALQVAAGFPYLVSGLIAPHYAVLGLWVLWGALLVLALQLRRRRPLWTPVVPVAAVLLWVAVMSFGGEVLGWTA